jgi:hypothetical protein
MTPVIQRPSIDTGKWPGAHRGGHAGQAEQHETISSPDSDYAAELAKVVYARTARRFGLRIAAEHSAPRILIHEAWCRPTRPRFVLRKIMRAPSPHPPHRAWKSRSITR